MVNHFNVNIIKAQDVQINDDKARIRYHPTADMKKMYQRAKKGRYVTINPGQSTYLK